MKFITIEKQRFLNWQSSKIWRKDVKVLGLNVINDLVKIDNGGAIIFVNLDEIKFKQKIINNVWSRSIKLFISLIIIWKLSKEKDMF
mgnify:CR=1 FL=1